VKLHVLSDLHLEFAPFTPAATDANVVVLAGDIGVGAQGLDWILAHFTAQPVVYVLGNHEFYREATPSLIQRLRGRCQGTNVHLLENDRVDIAGVSFLGCTLWTDFQLGGQAEIAELEADSAMNDFRLIRVSPKFRRLRARDTRRFHEASRRWLEAELSAVDRARTVVVTHHAPSPRLNQPRFAGQLLNAAFASDMESFIASSGVPLWVCGHTHWCADFRCGATRVLANQRGYPGEEAGSFRHDLVVEV
jgi:hypothetical protein